LPNSTFTLYFTFPNIIPLYLVVILLYNVLIG